VNCLHNAGVSRTTDPIPSLDVLSDREALSEADQIRGDLQPAGTVEL
jgi:hypothetical protein